MTTTRERPKFLAVDFFCGAGGTTRGLLDAGGFVIAGIDKVEAYRKTYQANNANPFLADERPEYLAFDMFPKTVDYPEGQQAQIRESLDRLIWRYRALFPGTPLLFAICAPCQSFTKFVQRRMTVDRAEGRERDRSLLAQTIPFIEKYRPELIMSENVANIEGGRYRHIWAGFRQCLEERYETGHRRVCASRFGVPQFRRRSILFAIEKSGTESNAFDLPVPDSDPDASLNPLVGDAIGHFPPLAAGGKSETVSNHECRGLTLINYQRLKASNPGESNWGLGKTEFGDLRLPCHKRLEDKGRRGFGDAYTRMRPDRPAPTITTRFHSISNGRFGHYDPNQVRGLSLREGATLQSFEEGYIFYGRGGDSVARMIGNAVPPKLSRFMANAICDLWKSRIGIGIS